MDHVPLRLRRIRIGFLRVPFREAFKHASHERNETETLIIALEAADGTVGVGEGCPRSYVTGETLQSAVQYVRGLWTKIASQDPHEIVTQLPRSERESIDKNPAAFCAVELALLDLLGRGRQKSVEALLELPVSGCLPPATFVIGLGTRDERMAKWRRGFRLGFRHFKFKIRGEADDLQLLEDIGTAPKPPIRWPSQAPFSVRVDGNGCFTNVRAARSFLRSVALPLTGIEEPFPRGEDASILELAQVSRTPVILDESFCRLDQLATWLSQSSKIILNLRVSKLGGLQRSVEIHKAARKAKIATIVGCQVGETSLLTRAAVALARFCDIPPLSFEGGFASHLMVVDPVRPSLGLAVGGRIRGVGSLASRSGLGCEFDFSRVDWQAELES